MKPSVRMAILARDHFRCRYCGRTPSEVVLEVDHAIPRALGGSNEVTNLVTACRDCNSGKSDTPYVPPDQVFSEEAARRAIKIAGHFVKSPPWANPVMVEHNLKSQVPGFAELIAGHSIKVQVGEQVRTWIMCVPD